jgi:bifunctional non-homologous end joining protein LigD
MTRRLGFGGDKGGVLRSAKQARTYFGGPARSMRREAPTARPAGPALAGRRLRLGKGRNSSAGGAFDLRMPRRAVGARRNTARAAEGRNTAARTRARAGRPLPVRDREQRRPPVPLPAFIAPCLCTAADAVPPGDGWLHEIKWDGYRLMARVERGKTRLLTRNGYDWTGRFPAVARAAAELAAEAAYLDGEVIVEDRRGVSDFAALKAALAAGRADKAVLFAFDLLHLDGEDLRSMPLFERKARLAALLERMPRGFPIRYSEHLEEHGEFMFRQASAMGLEGIISKRRNAPYVSGRSDDWLKIRHVKRHEFVVAGYLPAKNRPKAVSSLVLGWYEGDDLVYVGRVGSGFAGWSAREVWQRLQPLRRDTPPFAAGRPPGGAAQWVEPELVAEVTYGDWSSEEFLRLASFKGLREDKPAREVTRERIIAPAAVPQPRRKTETATRRASAEAPPAQAGEARTRARPVADIAEAGAGEPATLRRDAAPKTPRGKAAGSEVTTLNRSANAREERVPASAGAKHASRAMRPRARLPVPAENILQLLPDAVVPSPAALAAYWRRVADEALEYLGRRPLKLVRHVKGVTFYHRGPLPPIPGAVHQLRIEKREGGQGTRLWVDSLDGLLGLVEIGAVELHPWGATVDDIERPDMLVFDLDAGEGIPWTFVIETAMTLRGLLNDEGLETWPKLTGGKGVHVMVPVEPALEWDAAHAYCKDVAQQLAATNPDRYTISAALADRRGRLFVDYLRNGRGTTAIGTYSPRARPGFPIAAPVTWGELQAGIGSEAFTMDSAPLPRRAAAPARARRRK